MRKESTESRSESRPEWEQLEDWVRSQVQRLIQELLEEEVTAFLGRAKSALRSDSGNDTGYRNGYGRARRLTLSSGTIQLRRPRVDTEEQFESRLLPLFVNRTGRLRSPCTCTVYPRLRSPVSASTVAPMSLNGAAGPSMWKWSPTSMYWW